MPRTRATAHRQYQMPLTAPWDLSKLTAGGGPRFAERERAASISDRPPIHPRKFEKALQLELFELGEH